MVAQSSRVHRSYSYSSNNTIICPPITPRPPSASKDAFFAPPPQAEVPSPESFDTEVDNEVGELDFNWSFDQFGDFYSTYRGTIPPAAMS
jgi:hypothetical protein